MNPLLRRQGAIAVARKRFENKRFVWGKADCARLAAVTLAALGLKPGLSRAGHYSTAMGAARALLKCGYSDVTAWMDDVAGLERIPFAFALPGDIIAIGAENDAEGPALAVFIGGNKALAFAQGETADAPKVCRIGILMDVPMICWKATLCQ